MSAQKDLLLHIAAALSTGNIDCIADWFAEDFELHDPNFPNCPKGHEGARLMLASIQNAIPNLRAEVLDLVEQADRIAARWRFSGTRDGAPCHLTAVGIYRFTDGRIAEDWGMASRADWPEAKS